MDPDIDLFPRKSQNFFRRQPGTFFGGVVPLVGDGMSLAHRMGTVVAFHIFRCYCDVRNNFWPLQKFKTSHVLLKFLSLKRDVRVPQFGMGQPKTSKKSVFWTPDQKAYTKQSPWVETRALPWRVGGAKFWLRFSVQCAFCPCGLPLFQLKYRFNSGTVSTQGLGLVLKMFCFSLFNFVPEKTHVGPKNIVLRWDELGSLGLRGISPRLNITAINLENLLLSFLLGVQKKLYFKIFGRALLDAWPKSPCSGIKTWKMAPYLFWVFATAKS